MTKSPIWEGTWDWNQSTNCALSPSEENNFLYSLHPSLIPISLLGLFLCVTLFQIHNPHEESAMLPPPSEQIKKLKTREVNSPAQGHTIGEAAEPG